MLHHIKKLFGIKPKAEVQAEVPYKVETPVAETASAVMVESIAPAKKKPAAKKTRAPRKPKSE